MVPLCELVKTGGTRNEELNSHAESEGFPATLKDPAVPVQAPVPGGFAAWGPELTMLLR